MGATTTNPYYCSRLGITLNNGDHFIINGPVYTSVYAQDVAVNYNNEEVIFYGIYENPNDQQVATLITADPYGNARYFFKDSNIVSLLTNTYSFDANGGSGAPSSQTKNYGQSFTFPSTKPTKTGHTFQGWTEVVDGSTIYEAGNTYDNLPDKPTTWYAKWSANTYKIRYKPSAESSTTLIQNVTYGISWTTKGEVFKKTGHTLTSWNTKPDGSGTRYSLSKAQTNKQSSDLTLYAIWTRNKYTVTFNGNGGTIEESLRSVYYGDSIGTLPSASKKYYKFVGWFTAASGGTQIDSDYVITDNITLYAQYVEDNIVYVNNGSAFVPGHAYVLVNGSWVEAKKVYILKSGEWVSSISGG